MVNWYSWQCLLSGILATSHFWSIYMAHIPVEITSVSNRNGKSFQSRPTGIWLMTYAVTGNTPSAMICCFDINNERTINALEIWVSSCTVLPFPSHAWSMYDKADWENSKIMVFWRDRLYNHRAYPDPVALRIICYSTVFGIIEKYAGLHCMFCALELLSTLLNV